MNRFDAIRQQHPTLGFALYAYEPGAGVTLEIIDETGDVFTVRGETADQCLATAFPETGAGETEAAGAEVENVLD